MGSYGKFLPWMLLMLAAFGAVMFFLSKKSKKRQQLCLIDTEDGRLVEETMEVRLGHLINDKAMEAYLLCPETLITKAGTDMAVAILDERDATPPPISEAATKKREKFTADKAIEKIAASSGEREVMKAERNVVRDRVAKTVSFIIGAFAVVTLIVIIAGIFFIKKGA